MNKKGEIDEAGGEEIAAEKAIFLPLMGIVIVILVFAIFGMLVSYNNQLSYVSPKLKAELISLRFVNIPECFGYQDEKTGRVYPGVIDISKFNREQMDKCYWTEKERGFKDYNFGLSLREEGLNVSTNNFFNQVDFTIYKEVLVKKGEHWLKDQLIIKVQEKI